MKTSTGFILTISCLLLILDCSVYQYPYTNKEHPFDSEQQYNSFDIPPDAQPNKD